MRFKKLFEQSIKDTKQKIRESVTKDQLISGTVAEVEDLDKVCNILVKRLRDLYSFYNPEFSKQMSDNERFSELIVKNSKKDLLKKLNVKDSMGADLEKVDVDSIIEFGISLRKNKPDCLLAIGGGSAIDSAKGIARVLGEDTSWSL